MTATNVDRTLGRIEGHLEGIREDIGELKQGQTEAVAKIQNLESWRTHATGFAGAVAFIVSLIVTAITSGLHIGR